jgi:hypothetical protein
VTTNDLEWGYVAKFQGLAEAVSFTLRPETVEAKD